MPLDFRSMQTWQRLQMKAVTLKADTEEVTNTNKSFIHREVKTAEEKQFAQQGANASYALRYQKNI